MEFQQIVRLILIFLKSPINLMVNVCNTLTVLIYKQDGIVISGSLT